jgi:hypothetical protein
MNAPDKIKRPATFDRLRKKQPLQKLVTIPLSSEAVEAYDRAENALERARLLNETDKLSGLELELEGARAHLENESETLVFQSMGRLAYDDLVEEHPPTEEQIKEFQEANGGKGRPPYNIDTFAPALVAASCVEPQMTVDEVNVLFTEWNATEVAELWVAALEVNTQRRVVSLGNA